MIATVAQEINDALKEIEQINPITVSVGSNNYVCSIGSQMSGSKLGEGGWGGDADVRIVIRLQVIGINPLPIRKSKLTLRGVLLRIDDITTDPTQTYIVLSCVDPSRGV